MDPELWKRVSKVFDQVHDATHEDRAAALTEACRGDSDLRAAVEQLLEADAEGTFLGKPAPEQLASILTPEEPDPDHQIDQYSLVRQIGQGGMGVVYLAERADGQYEQRVAIKFLRRSMDSEVGRQRFFNERQILARLQHPGIARLLDGGVTRRGRPYFVMEYIAGVPLIEYCDRERLSIRDRLQLFGQICAAVLYAHRHLVIHRDLKPSNTLVTEDGMVRLLDFGIAKLIEDDPAEGDATQTAMRVLTPQYAAPEQVSGDPVSTATDIYALGVMLYELLSGKRPYSLNSLSPGEIERVLSDKAPRPPSTAVRRAENEVQSDFSEKGRSPEERAQDRGLTPNGLSWRLSGDLDAIVLKALRKQPRNRFESVSSMAEDIDRHLEGLPIRARPASLSYRAWKRIRRHPWGSLAAGVILLLAVLTLYIRSQADSQARIAQRFGQEVERIDSRMRLAYLMPLHDVRSDQQEVREELTRLEEQMESLGRLAEGPGHSALGRGFQSLGDHENARQHLQAAWDAGYRTPRTAVALGRALGSLYSDRLVRAAQLSDAEVRETERRLAKAELGDRALELLGQVDPRTVGLDAHEAVYLEGLMSFYEEDWESARESAMEAARLRDWFYEADLLGAEVARSEATEAISSGAMEAAATLLEESRRSLGVASTKAPSDPQIYLGLCRLEKQAVIRSRDMGLSPEDAYSRALRACDLSLTAHPELVDPLLKQSEVSWLMARDRVGNGQDPGSSLDYAIAKARTAISLEPRNHEAFAHLGNAQWVRANWESFQGRPAEEPYENAIRSFERGLELAPGNAFLLLSLGHALLRQAQYAGFRGRDPLPTWRSAAEIYRRALTEPGATSSRVYNGLCALHEQMGYHLFQRGEDPSRDFAEGIQVCEKALAIKADYLSAFNNMGMIYWDRAEYEASEGIDPVSSFGLAIQAFTRVLEISPKRPTASVNLTNLLVTRGRLTFKSGGDPAEDLGQAAKTIEATLEAYPGDYRYLASKIDLLKAESGQGGPPDIEEAFSSAERNGRAAWSVEQTLPYGTQMAAVYRARAGWRIRSKASPEVVRADVSLGLEWVTKLLEMDPKYAEALAHRVALERRQAQLSGDLQEREKWTAAAHRSLQQLGELRADLAREFEDSDPRHQ